MGFLGRTGEESAAARYSELAERASGVVRPRTTTMQSVRV